MYLLSSDLFTLLVTSGEGTSGGGTSGSEISVGETSGKRGSSSGYWITSHLG